MVTREEFEHLAKRIWDCRKGMEVKRNDRVRASGPYQICTVRGWPGLAELVVENHTKHGRRRRTGIALLMAARTRSNSAGGDAHFFISQKRILFSSHN